MAKRVTESRLKKYAIGAGLTTIPLGIVLIIFLTMSGSIDVTSYSGDMVCDDTCFINITFTANEDVFIYPMNGSWMLEFDNPDAIHLVKMYRTWGSGLREINLSKKCTGTWCGKSPNDKRDTAAFVYAFRKGKEYTLVYEINKDAKADVKWSFFNDLVDPYLIGDKTNDDVFTNLTYNDEGKMEATFNAFVPSENSNITITFKEKCGTVKSYELMMNSTCYNNVTEYYYDCTYNNETLKNKTIITHNNCTKHLKSWKNVGSQCWKPVKSVYGNVNYKIKADIKPAICKDTHKLGYEVDWVPSLTSAGVTYTQDKWAWWNASFSYYKRVNVTGTPVALNSNYTIVATSFYCGANCQANGDDIRAIYNTGAATSILDYGLRRMNATAGYWNITYPVSSAVGKYNESTYIYYGYAAIPSANKTYDYVRCDWNWDGFENNGSGNWSVTSGAKTTNTVYAKNGNYGAFFYYSGTKASVFYPHTTNGQNLKYEYWINNRADLAYQRQVSNGVPGTNRLWYLSRDNVADQSTHYYNGGNQDYGKFEQNYWYKETVTWQDSNKNVKVWFGNETEMASDGPRLGYNNIDVGDRFAVILNSNVASKGYFDDLCIKSHVFTAPTISFGAEQSGNSGPIFSGAGDNVTTLYDDQTIQVHVTITDATGASLYRMATNASGAWSNGSWGTWVSGNQVTKKFKNTIDGGKTLGWTWYANDTLDALSQSKQTLKIDTPNIVFRSYDNITVFDSYAPNFSKSQYFPSDWYTDGNYFWNITEKGINITNDPPYVFNITNFGASSSTFNLKLSGAADAWWSWVCDGTTMTTTAKPIKTLAVDEEYLFNCTLTLTNASQKYLNWALSVNKATWNGGYTSSMT